MHKPIALATSVALLVTGCQSRSLTWHKVMATPRAVGDAENGDRVYAGALHQNLGATPHKVVTFEVDYFSKLRGSETTHRTAVIYQDEQNQRHPWWVMDHTLDKPVWVPNKPLADQVAFFARRQARVVEVQDYTVSREKSVQQLELAHRPVGTSKLQRPKGSKPAVSTTVIHSKPVETAPAAAPQRKRGLNLKFWEKSAPKKAEATTSMQPVKGSSATNRKSDAPTAPGSTTKEPAVNGVTPATESKAPNEKPAEDSDLPVKDAPKPRKEPAKPAEKAKEVPAAAAEKAQPSAVPKREEKTPAATSTSQENPAVPAAKPAKAGDASKPSSKKKSEPAAEPKKRRPLFHRDSTEPATPRPADGADAEQPRRNMFQRILSTLNPVRWFRRAA